MFSESLFMLHISGDHRCWFMIIVGDLSFQSSSTTFVNTEYFFPPVLQRAPEKDRRLWWTVQQFMWPLSKSFHWSGVADVVSHPVSLIVSTATRYLTSQCVDSFFVEWLFMITDTAVVKFCSCGNLLKRALRLLFSHHWSQRADPLLKAYVASEINTQSEILTGSQVGYNIEEKLAPPLTIHCLLIPNTRWLPPQHKQL